MPDLEVRRMLLSMRKQEKIVGTDPIASQQQLQEALNKMDKLDLSPASGYLKNTYDHIQLIDEDIQNLSKALAQNQTITEINLKRNLMTDTGAESLRRALITNTTLTTVNFLRNQLSFEAINALNTALDKNLEKYSTWQQVITTWFQRIKNKITQLVKKNINITSPDPPSKTSSTVASTKPPTISVPDHFETWGANLEDTNNKSDKNTESKSEKSNPLPPPPTSGSGPNLK